jgi:hypothetical protein
MGLWAQHSRLPVVLVPVNDLFLFGKAVFAIAAQCLYNPDNGFVGV